MSDFLEVLKVAGPWGGPVLIFGLLYARGYIATGRECKQLAEAIATLTRERERERNELRQELHFWRDLAWSTSKIADQVASALPLHKDQR